MLDFVVAPLAGSVDRNWTSKSILVELDVAPLAGSVDRNEQLTGGVETLFKVAPLAGSVDRNGLYRRWLSLAVLSLPLRGAWIEIAGSA